MNSYYYQTSLVKSSIKKCDIRDRHGEFIGSIQRYFNSTLHSIVDSVFGRNNLIVRMKATNPEGVLMIDAYTEIAMIKRPNYYLKFINGRRKGLTFQARQLNHIKINPEFIIKSPNLEIISKTSINDWVRFYENGKEIARWRYRAKEKYKANIEVEEGASIQDALFYAILGHLLYFIGY